MALVVPLQDPIRPLPSDQGSLERTDDGRSRTDRLRRGRLSLFVHSPATAAGGGVEKSIEEGHRRLRHRAVGTPRLLLISNFCDERDESLSAIDREPNHAEVGASGKDRAKKLLGLRGPAGRRQAFGKQAFGS
jgi:hypothetical protein